jgi:MraZ protein
VDENGSNPAIPARPPLGMYPARLDEKGRLKLPTVFQQYFNSFAESKLFITSLDGRTGQIYNIAAWRANESLFEEYTEDPDALQDLLFNAQDLGAEADMDTQGRVTVNSELRRELDLQGQELHLFAYKNHVQILTEAIYQERRLRARPKGKDNLDKLERAGLK